MFHTHTHTPLCHTQLCHIHTQLCRTQLCHTPSFNWPHLPAFRMAGVALVALDWLWWRFADIDIPFAWQAWHLVTSTFHLRGRRVTCSHPPSFCMAGVALGDKYLRLAWLASTWHWAGSGARLVAVSHRGRCGTLRGRRGTW